MWLEHSGVKAEVGTLIGKKSGPRIRGSKISRIIRGLRMEKYFQVAHKGLRPGTLMY